MALINVSKDGNDSNDGSTLALSKLTITAAHTSAVDGDVIRLCTPGGEWREDGGSGAIDLAKAGLTAGIDIIGMDPRNPPIISGVSGTASVRISTSGYRFKNLIIDSSSDANTSLALINSSDPITVGFENVKFCATHDISTGSGYMLNMIGTGAHSLTLEDCEFEQWCRYLHGIYLSGAGAHRILRTKVNMVNRIAQEERTIAAVDNSFD